MTVSSMPYSRRLIWAHWSLAAVVLWMLFLGDIMPLGLHLGLGVLIGIGFSVRWLWRREWGRNHPAQGKTLHWVKGFHLMMYWTVASVILSGVWLAWEANVWRVLFEPVGLPEGYTALAAYQVHRFVTNLLLGMIALHVMAAIYHGLILRDDVLSKMVKSDRS